LPPCIFTLQVLILRLQVIYIAFHVGADFIHPLVAYDIERFHIVVAKTKADREMGQVDHARKFAFVVKNLNAIVGADINVPHFIDGIATQFAHFGAVNHVARNQDNVVFVPSLPYEFFVWYFGLIFHDKIARERGCSIPPGGFQSAAPVFYSRFV